MTDYTKRYDQREQAGQMRLGDIREHRSYYMPSAEQLPAVDWKPPRLADLPSWRDAKRVGIDVECRDEQLKPLGPGCRRDPSTNYMVGVSFAIEDGPEFYLPIRHMGGDNCEGDVVGYLREQVRGFNGTIVANGFGYDGDWLAQSGVPEILEKKIMDVQVLDPLLNELHDRYNLEAMCFRHGLPGKDETILRMAAAAYRVDPKVGLWKMAAKFVGRYGEIDARRPLQLLRRQERVMETEGVQQIWALEQQVTPILVKMRRLGVRVDLKHLEAVEVLSLRKEAEHLDHLQKLTGVRVAVGDVWKVEVLARALRAASIEPPKTETRVGAKGKLIGGKDSVDAEFLAKCGKVGTEILRARKWNKLRTTFCKQVKQALIGDRVHCTFNQLKSSDEDEKGEGRGVRYGRLSSSNFNVQQQPIRDDEFGEMWRQIFIADEGARFASSDWSQQEPRIGVHYAEILKLPGAKEFGDEYRRNPKLDIHQALTDLAADPVNYPRKVVKNFVNGRLYGMGDVKLCHHLGWKTEWRNDPRDHGKMREYPTIESQAKIDHFKSFAPWIPGLTQNAARAAEKNGFVWTWLRRKCRFEKGPDGRIWKAHKAFNRVGQGTAADQMKATLVECWKEGIQIQLAVHDEFDFSFDDIKVARRVKHLQKTVVQFTVPMNVDLEIGESWGKLVKDVE